MGKLKRSVCVAESDCFLFRATRGACIVENDCAALARVGNESFRRRGARWLYRGNAKNLTRAGRGTDSSGSRGGAGSPIEGKQKAFVPPPAGRAGRVPREVFRGKCRIPPAGFASRGRVTSPRRETRRPPLGASGALPPRFARLRGRGLPRFCRLHHVGPLRPGTKNLPPPDPRVGNTNILNEIIPARLT